jgi:hypothetical protein
MRNLLALGAAGLLAFAVIGWYRGWYKVQTEPAADGHREVTIDLNSPQISADINKGKEKLHDMLNNKGTTTVQSVPPGTNPAPQVPPPPENWTSPTQGPTDGFQGVYNVPPAPVLPDAVAVPPPPGSTPAAGNPSTGKSF